MELTVKIFISGERQAEIWRQVADNILYGAVQYWAILLDHERATIRLQEESSQGEFLVTTYVLLGGLQRLVSPEFKIAAPWRSLALGCLTDDVGDIDIDAELADIIVQAAVFGEIVYG